MLITNLQTAATLSAAGQGLLATKTTLSATTAAVQLHGQLTPGAGTANLNGRPRVVIYIAVSPFDISTAVAVRALREQAVPFDLQPNQENGVVKIKMSEFVPAVGTYAYVWADVPAFGVAPVLDLKIAELN